MQLEKLQGHIRTLAMLPESETDVVSCYLREGKVACSNSRRQSARC
jgi:hypothetical protein